MKKLVVGIIGAVVILVLGFIGYLVYDAHQTAEINKRIQADAKAVTTQPKEEAYTTYIPVGTIKQTADDMNKKVLFKTQEIADQLQKDIGKPMTPTDVYHLLAQGYSVTYMKNHQYAFLDTSDKSGQYIVVTFNDDETSITKVDYIHK